MLRHTGKSRRHKHNIRLASLLCLNAGFINAAGFLAFRVLTTNVTGHAALLAVYAAEADLRSMRMVALWLFLFLLGAFCSGLYMALSGGNRPFTYTVPILIIIFILLFTATFGYSYHQTLFRTESFAGSLLFSMGMQNALVSGISGTAVRTTHLTGTFTDLGIDLSIFVLNLKKPPQFIKRRIALRIAIIFFFLLGGVAGGFIFSKYSFKAFYVPVAILLIAIFYDYLRVNVKRLLR